MTGRVLNRLRSQNRQTTATLLDDIPEDAINNTQHHRFSTSVESFTQKLNEFNTKRLSSSVLHNRHEDREFVSIFNNLRPNLDQLLYSSEFNKIRVEFLQYARELHFEENILYMLDFERLKKLRKRQTHDAEIDAALALDRAQDMIDRYIVDGAEHQVNISDSLRSLAMNNVAEQDIQAAIDALAKISSSLKSLLEQHLFDDFMGTQHVYRIPNTRCDGRPPLRKRHSMQLPQWRSNIADTTDRSLGMC